jgi:translation initiation factor RLI1
MCICYGVQKCPFDAIMIINLPKDLEKETTHRYGPNSFKLHRCAGSGLAGSALHATAMLGS